MKQFLVSWKFLYALNKKLFIVSLILPLLTAVLMITILVMKFYPYHILDVKKTTILSTRVRAGDDLIYQITYCKYIDIPAKVTRTLIGLHNRPDGSENYLPIPFVITITHLGCATATIHLPISHGAEPDIYYMKANAEFTPNPLRTIDVPFSTDNTFEIYH